MAIPPSLHHFFWDVDVARLDPEKKPYFVINRLLDKGDIEAVKWVKNHFEPRLIKETFTSIKDFNVKIGTFWSLILHIPKEDVLCIQEPYLKMRRMHWPY